MVLRFRRSQNSLRLRGSASGHCGRFLVECRIPQNPFHTHVLILSGLADGPRTAEGLQAGVCTTRLGPHTMDALIGAISVALSYIPQCNLDCSVSGAVHICNPFTQR